MNLSVFICRAVLGIIATIATFGAFSDMAVGQFVGGTPRGSVMSVKAARAAEIDTYVVVTGSIVAHLREDYYTFRDATGDIRVEISDRVWSGRPVTPENKVSLVAEVDRNSSGLVYLWVQSLEIIK